MPRVPVRSAYTHLNVRWNWKKNKIKAWYSHLARLRPPLTSGCITRELLVGLGAGTWNEALVLKRS